MAKWAKDDGTVGEASDLRLRKVLYYLSHSIKINEKYVPYLFAAVAWFSRHSSKLGYGKPLEIWNNDFINDGSSFFLPIHMITLIAVKVQYYFHLTLKGMFCSYHLYQICIFSSLCNIAYMYVQCVFITLAS